jgi:hypothetical protein
LGVRTFLGFVQLTNPQPFGSLRAFYLFSPTSRISRRKKQSEERAALFAIG